LDGLISIALLIIGVGILLFVILAYPYIQEKRENELAKRLENIDDPAIASSWVDSARQTPQEEAGFFRRLQIWCYAIFRGWW
jgi:hypothetical protein